MSKSYKKTIKGDTAKDELLRAAELAEKADSLIREIHDLTGDTETDDPTYSKILLKTVDGVAEVKYHLEAMTDGRPRPFSLPERHNSFVDYLKDPEAKAEAQRNFKMWGEVGPASKKYPDESAAYIASQSFKLNELKELQAWISEVIAFVEQKIK